jgi:hypothetical protein
MSFDVGRDGLDDEDAMVGTLLAIHRRRQERARRADPGGAAARILGHFERRGQRLRGERLVTAELIERLFQGGKALPVRRVQQELEVVGVPGGTAAGRVRVANRGSERARFDLVVGEPLRGQARPRVTFDPGHAELAAGETVLVRVEAHLGGWRAGDSVTLPVECRWAGGSDRLWLVISIPGAGARAR